jgi:hypothetical protein
MTATVHAFFENGRFRPVEPVGLPDRSLAEIQVRTSDEPEVNCVDAGRTGESLLRSWRTIRLGRHRHRGST